MGLFSRKKEAAVRKTAKKWNKKKNRELKKIGGNSPETENMADFTKDSIGVFIKLRKTILGF